MGYGEARYNMAIYVSHIIGSIVNHLNNTGSVGGGSYTHGSWIDPYEQKTLNNRTNQAYGSDFHPGGQYPRIQVLGDDISPEKLTMPKQGHHSSQKVLVQVFYYAKAGTFFTDTNGDDHKDEDHVRSYLEYIRRGISNRYAPDFPSLHHITPGTISNVTIHPQMQDTFWGMVPIEVIIYNTGSGF